MRLIMTAKKLTAEELAVKMEMGNHDWADDAAEMLRQQQAEIEVLKSDTIPYKDLHQVVKNVLAGGTPDSELAEHKQIIREQQAEIEALKKARCVACGWNPNLIGEERGNKALRNNEIGKILTKVLDDCGLLKKASEK